MVCMCHKKAKGKRRYGFGDRKFTRGDGVNFQNGAEAMPYLVKTVRRHFAVLGPRRAVEQDGWRR